MYRVLCLTALVSCAWAIVCEPNICATVDCAQVDDASCNGVVKPNGGFCGCCDACVVTLAEGDTCMGSILLGVPADNECGENLYCDPDSLSCQPLQVVARQTDEPGPCAVELQNVEDTLAASEQPLLGLEKPNCDENGFYAGMQVIGSQAFCVTQNGTEIEGFMVNRWETGDDMNCQCARDLYDYMQSGLIGKLFDCEANGNYKPGDEN